MNIKHWSKTPHYTSQELYFIQRCFQQYQMMHTTPTWYLYTALWANTWTFLKKSTLFFDITSLPIFSLCLPHLHNVIRDIFLSEIDETQKKDIGVGSFGFDATLQYIAGDREIRENV